MILEIVKNHFKILGKIKTTNFAFSNYLFITREYENLIDRLFYELSFH